MRIAVLFLLVCTAFRGQAEPKDDVGRMIVKVNSGGFQSTGFFWKNSTTIITVLHGIGNQRDISVYIPGLPGKNKWKQASLQKVYKDGDLVLLKVEGYASPHFISSCYSSRPPVDTKAFTVGYHQSCQGYMDKDFTVGMLEGGRLENILPSSAKQRIRQLTFPSLTIDIVYLKGHLTHGFSGSPIVDLGNGKLIGVSDGGLDNGSSSISWCISATSIARLEQSTESFPAINLTNMRSVFSKQDYPAERTIFHSDEEFRVFKRERGLEREEIMSPILFQETFDGTATIDSFAFRKIKTISFEELDETADYSTDPEMGLHELINRMNQEDIRYNRFQFDLYREETTGATLLIPTGLRLTKEDGLLVARSEDGSCRMLITLKQTTDSTQTYLDFETKTKLQTQTYERVRNPSPAYAGTTIRWANLVISRSAFSCNGQSGCEIIAQKETTFLGVFVLTDAQASPAQAAYYNLAAQLSTYGF